MRQPKRTFYVLLAAVYPLFFLLHWNGLFSQTYYWALEAIGATQSGLAQAVFAFISSALLFGAIALVFGLGTALFRRPTVIERERMPQEEGS